MKVAKEENRVERSKERPSRKHIDGDDNRYYSPWLTKLRDRFNRDQRKKERDIIINVRTKIEADRPSLPEGWPKQLESWRAPGHFLRQYKSALKSPYGNLFLNVDEKSLVELTDCLAHCALSCDLKTFQAATDSQRRKILEIWKEDSRTRLSFSKLSIEISAHIFSLCPPTNWNEPLYDCVPIATLWMSEVEAKGLLTSLRLYLDANESMKGDRLSQGQELVNFYSNFLSFKPRERVAKRANAGKRGTREIFVAPNIHSSQCGRSYNFPGLVMEVSSFFNWVFMLWALRMRIKEENEYYRRTEHFKVCEIELIREKLSQRFDTWCLLKNENGEVFARGTRRGAEKKWKVVGFGPKFERENKTDVSESEPVSETDEDVAHFSLKILSCPSSKVTSPDLPARLELTNLGRERLLGTKGWYTDDIIYVYLQGILAERALRSGTDHVAFVAPPYGIVRVRKERGSEGLLGQNVMKRSDGLVVAVLNIHDCHWFTLYAYRDEEGLASMLVLDSAIGLITQGMKRLIHKFGAQMDAVLCAGSNCGYSSGKHHTQCNERVKDWENAKIRKHSTWPCQRDGFNCGPFALQAARIALETPTNTILSGGLSTQFTEDDCGANFRSEIREELVGWDRTLQRRQ